MVLDFRRIKERGWSFRLVWDLFMIFLAVINLLMILFDLTYFLMRPYYRMHTPELVQIYDPYKGVETNPEFEQFRQTASQYFRLAEASAPEANEQTTERAELRLTLAELSEGIGSTYTDFFEATGQLDSVRTMTARMHEALPPEQELVATRRFRLQDVGPRFWTDVPSDEQRRIYEESIDPTFDSLFYRHRQVDGSFVDRFILLDAPFLILFLLEFLGRWIISVRRKMVARWWLFPVYNWYDILGLIPFAYFRVFRLVRILSIYIRLHRSELTTVGQDIFSRTFRRYSNILTEELSDRVAVRILAEMQAEIRGGASLDIVANALRQKREPIKKIIIETLQNFSTDTPALDDTRDLLSSSLERAAGNVPSLRLVPDFIKTTLTREIGLAVFDAINESMVGAWEDERGAQLISEAVDFALEEMRHPDTGRKLDELYREIAIDVIENLKESVAVKQWARQENDAKRDA
ncbi:MAG: hypothetical protein CMN76_03560 [Spirochaetaceae bacterium]|nr:hypothetical protein [Spirochaetaceae bacterium]|tara:strand:+ start:169229 stop:170623 length:1395 start_codon:yes stop_codon:yes gene_type:complete